MDKIEVNKIVNASKLNQFRTIELLDKLSCFLKVNTEVFSNRLNYPVYTTNKIPKKKGGWRELLVPETELMRIQSKLNVCLQLYFNKIKPDCVHGFLMNERTGEELRSIVSNAQAHVGKSFLLNIDLKNFFPSISAKRINELLHDKLNLFPNEKMANAVTLLCTYKGFLPTGAPTSPVLSNIVCLPLDYELSTYCENNQITYTRYADDLSFSSNRYFSEKCISEIRQIIKEQQFAINEKKFRINSRKSQQRVTGLVVNNKVNVDRTYIKTIRACLHNWKLNGLEHATAKHYFVIAPSTEEQAQFSNKLKGQIEFIGMVRGKKDEIYIKYKGEFKYLIGSSVFP